MRSRHPSVGTRSRNERVPSSREPHLTHHCLKLALYFFDNGPAAELRCTRGDCNLSSSGENPQHHGRETSLPLLCSNRCVAAGFRGRIITARENLWKGRPMKALTHGLSRTGGRNSQGQVTVRHRGGGAKRLYRVIDFKRKGEEASGVVERVEYDPNRSARIALIRHEQGDVLPCCPCLQMCVGQNDMH